MKLILTALIIVSILHVNAQSNPTSGDSKTKTEKESLQQVIDNYNLRIGWWDKNASLIDLSKPIIIQATQGDKLVTNKNIIAITANNPKARPVAIPSFADRSLDEITVTTAMGLKKLPKEIGYSIAVVGGDDLTRAKVTSIATGMAAKVSSMQVNLVNNGVKADTRVTLRGDRSILGNNQALLVVDDVQLPISYIGSLNPNDVDRVTVLKGPSASALYGSDASNGVIIVTTQKGKASSDGSAWRRYKLEDAEDVNYMRKIQRASPGEYVTVYEKFEKQNFANVGFYLDMADFFFQKGMQEKAKEILHRAFESSYGNADGLIAVAYTFESWKIFGEAINIYKNILEKNNDAEIVKRDLALAYFQNGNYQLSLNTYYSIIIKNGNESGSINSLKQIAMDEMNALIALHSTSLDLTAINLRLVRPLPVDLRVSLETNDRTSADLLIKEPGGQVCNAASPNSRYGGHLSSADYDSEGSFYDYSIKNAPAGTYSVITNAYNRNTNTIPHMVRIIIFKNFQKPGQTIETKNVILDNQYGEVEIGDVAF